MKFQIGDKVEALHNRVMPTGRFGTVVRVHEHPTHGVLLAVTADDTHFSPMWDEAAYFRKVDDEH